MVAATAADSKQYFSPHLNRPQIHKLQFDKPQSVGGGGGAATTGPETQNTAGGTTTTDEEMRKESPGRISFRVQHEKVKIPLHL